ncbi:hypothetical protein KL866_19910 [Alteromonas sp. ALT199]|uniref:hypothetical protein n=1 Tax=unclassified Alteromonas TaxID=2614992 RepID=UPI00044E5C99|nr:hypothetical protein [Alteromonas sp. ALT199]MBT3137316.1 hypothetical protein [Alteromonas sp. ALT199]
MNAQILLEVGLISVMALITLTYISRSKASKGNKIQTFAIALLGGFMILGGTAKFFQPFATMFASQIELSGLPLPKLAKFAGQMGEITAGIMYLLLLTKGKFISVKLSEMVLNGATLLTVVIMTVAVYVHLSPNVPAEVLPFQSKPPVLTVIVMLISLGILIANKRKN